MLLFLVVAVAPAATIFFTICYVSIHGRCSVDSAAAAAGGVAAQQQQEQGGPSSTKGQRRGTVISFSLLTFPLTHYGPKSIGCLHIIALQKSELVRSFVAGSTACNAGAAAAANIVTPSPPRAPEEGAPPRSVREKHGIRKKQRKHRTEGQSFATAQPRTSARARSSSSSVIGPFFAGAAPTAAAGCAACGTATLVEGTAGRDTCSSISASVVSACGGIAGMTAGVRCEKIPTAFAAQGGRRYHARLQKSGGSHVELVEKLALVEVLRIPHWLREPFLDLRGPRGRAGGVLSGARHSRQSRPGRRRRVPGAAAGRRSARQPGATGNILDGPM